MDILPNSYLQGCHFSGKKLESGKSWGICVVMENSPHTNPNSPVDTLLILLFWLSTWVY